MSSSTNEIAHEHVPYFRAYKDGRIERFFGNDFVPPSSNAFTVSSKDVAIVPETGVSARIFMPINTINPSQKLPLLVYFHGGGFYMGSAFCSTYNNYVSSIVETANIIAVSVNYRLAPEHLVPAQYEDSWAALKWVASHFNNSQGPESWLNDHADFDRFFLAGDSAGANLAHNIAVQAGVEDLNGVKLSGICLIQPYFGRKCSGVDKCWLFVCPNTSGFNDPRINPAMDSRLSSLRSTTRVLVAVAENDSLRDRGVFYYEALKNRGWCGEVELVETQGEDHVFHLFKPESDKALALMTKLASFINQGIGTCSNK